MRDIWETWVGDQTVDEFLADADALVAAGTFADRRAAFVAYAGYVLPDRGQARRGPDRAEDGLSAVKLGELLLAHATAAERRDRPAGTGRAKRPTTRPAGRRGRQRILAGQSAAAPAATRGARPKRPRARRPKGK